MNYILGSSNVHDDDDDIDILIRHIAYAIKICPMILGSVSDSSLPKFTGAVVRLLSVTQNFGGLNHTGIGSFYI